MTLLVSQERRALALLVAALLIVAVGAALLEYLGPAPFAVPYSETLPDGTLAVVHGTLEDLTVAKGGHLIGRVGTVRVFVPASAVPSPPPGRGALVEVYGLVQTYEGTKELLVRTAADLRRTDQE